MVAVSASPASAKILKGAIGLIKAVDEHIYDVGREIRSTLLGTVNPAQAQTLPEASMAAASMTNVLIVSCGEESTDHLIWRLSCGTATPSSTPSLSATERCKFLAFSGEDDSMCKASSDDAWKKLEEKGAVLNKKYNEMMPDGLLRVVRAPSLGGGPPTASAGENQVVKEMLSKGKEARDKMRQKLQELGTANKDVTPEAFQDALKNAGMEPIEGAAAEALKILSPEGAGGVSESQLLGLFDDQATMMQDIEQRLGEACAAADLIIIALPPPSHGLTLHQTSKIRSALGKDAGTKAKTRMLAWIPSSSSPLSSSAPSDTGSEESRAQSARSAASAAASLLGLPAETSSILLCHEPAPASSSSSSADTQNDGFASLQDAVASCIEEKALSPVLDKAVADAGRLKTALCVAPSQAADRAQLNKLRAKANVGLDAAAASLVDVLPKSAHVAEFRGLQLQALPPEPKTQPKARAREQVTEPGGSTIAQQADAMLQRILTKTSAQPRPSMKMVGHAPFKAGVPQKGFEALGGRKLGSSSEEAMPEYLSTEWHAAHKTVVTDWGRKYTGVHAAKHWLAACDDQKRGGIKAGGEMDVPLPVGMRGHVLLFGFALCEWEVSAGQIRVGAGDSGEGGKAVESPLFSIWPVGGDFKWFRQRGLRQRFATSRQALEHISSSLDDKLKLGGNARESASGTDAASLFGLRDKRVVEFLRKHYEPRRASSLSEADAMRRSARAALGARIEADRMKRAEAEVGDMEFAMRHRKEVAAAAVSAKAGAKTIITPRVKGGGDGARGRGDVRDEGPTTEEKEQMLDDRRNQFLRACKLSLRVNRWLEEHNQANGRA